MYFVLLYFQSQSDVDAAQMMKETANLLNTKAAMQIRYLETMTRVNKDNANKIMYLPYDKL